MRLSADLIASQWREQRAIVSMSSGNNSNCVD
jgi:hypothetical protein